MERLLTLGFALTLDLLLGEPPAPLHPVVGLGRFVNRLVRSAPTESEQRRLVYGGLVVVMTIGFTGVLGSLAERATARLPLLPRVLARAVLLKPAFAVRELFIAGERVREPLRRGDLAEARVELRSLVSRDTSRLDASLIAAAAVESLAENASDSIVAPWLAYIVGGLPGAYVYRAANTLDAMIGYRGEYEYLGKIAARLDDALNLIPSRITAGLIVIGAALGGGSARRALVIARRDHGKTASPNAGWPMSAMAGALGVQLEKVGHYRLGDPYRPIKASDILVAHRVLERGIGAGVLALVGMMRVKERCVPGGQQ